MSHFASRTQGQGARFNRNPSPGDANSRPALDLVHLARQTLGDRDLETELLGLFVRQACTLVGTLQAAVESGGSLPPGSAAPLHTLCGSARAVGCWAVSETASAMERDVRAGGEFAPGMERLEVLIAAVDRACAAIEHVLGE